mmetsp:Transcript_23188/g.37063  ORF Transcript_23188/g.37063 Transcript_23188/m.37063 type:complete len:230 (+) Transcript_23188:77-766(+)
MGKGGAGRGRKPNHRRNVGNQDDIMERNGYTAGNTKEDESEDESDAEETATKKKAAPGMERDDELEAELEAQFADPSGLSRKQREELEQQEQQRKEEKARQAGETDEAKETLARLEEVRKRREEAAEKKRLEAEKTEAEKKARENDAKEPAGNSGQPVADQILELLRKAPDGKMTLNQLNQDASAKKVLKPLCKKHNVKAINKAWLEKFGGLFEIKEEGNDFGIYPKGT